MNKKLNIGLVFLVFTILATNSANAKPKSLLDSYMANNWTNNTWASKHDKNDYDKHKHAKLEPLLGLYMTDEGSTVPKENQTFGWDEKPYAFMQFDVDDLNTEKPLIVWWKWRYEKGPFVSFEWERITDFPEDNLNLWDSLDNWYVQKKVGEWTAQTTWRNPGSGGGMRKTHFTGTPAVSPEPISSILFLTGGAILAARCYRGKKGRKPKK